MNRGKGFTYWYEIIALATSLTGYYYYYYYYY